MNDCYDLHVHSIHSDGVLSPAELVKLAKGQGLIGIALTDHDTIQGITEAIDYGELYGIDVIPGIELSTYYLGASVHILGYYIDYKSKDLIDALLKFQEHRVNRMKKMVQKLNELGIDISIDEVYEVARGNNLGRPHLARVLIKKKYVSSIEEAFEKYIGKNKPAYVPKMHISVPEGINLINSAGGVPIIAHPLLCGKFSTAFLNYAVENGAKGFEVKYPYELTGIQNIVLNEQVREFCKSHGLIMTGGTDFHAPQESAYIGSKCVSSNVVKKLKQIK